MPAPFNFGDINLAKLERPAIRSRVVAERVQDVYDRMQERCPEDHVVSIRRQGRPVCNVGYFGYALMWVSYADGSEELVAPEAFSVDINCEPMAAGVPRRVGFLGEAAEPAPGSPQDA